MSSVSAYQLLAQRTVQGHVLTVFKRLDDSVVATLSGLGAVSLKGLSNHPYSSGLQQFLSSSDDSFFSLSGRTVEVHVKGSGGGQKGSKAGGGQKGSKNRSPEDLSNVSSFLESGGTSSGPSSILTSKTSEAVPMALGLLNDIKMANTKSIAEKAEALIRLSLNVDNQPKDPFLVVRHIVSALASDDAQGLDLVFKLKLAEALHRYVDLTVLAYSMEGNKKVLGTSKKEIDDKLEAVISLLGDESEANGLCFHLQASLAGLDSLRDTEPFVVNSMIRLATALGSQNVGVAVVLLQDLINRKSRASRSDWYIDLALIRFMLIEGSVKKSKSTLEEVAKALRAHQDWQFLFGGVQTLASVVKDGTTGVIKKRAFDELTDFVSFDQFKVQNNWRVRAGALEALIKLYGKVDDEINNLIKDQLIAREALESDIRVRRYFGQLQSIKELQTAWEQLLDGHKYEKLLSNERARLKATLSQYQEGSPEWYSANAEVEAQLDALDARQAALQKDYDKLKEKVDVIVVDVEKVKDRQKVQEEAISKIQKTLDSRNAFFDATLPAFMRAPHKNTSFCGRTELLTTLRTRFEVDTLDTLQVVLTGPKGIGKSALANAYLHDRKGRYNLIWWVFGQRAYDGIRDLGLALDIGLTPATPREQVIKAVRDYLEKNSGWLIVFDGVENIEAVKTFIPPKGGHVLLTTEKKTKDSMELTPLLPKEATDLFVKLTGVRDTTKAKELAALLLHNPMAITLASSFIEHKQISYYEYYDTLSKRGVSTDSPQAVIGTVWEITMEYFIDKFPRALPFIQGAAFFDSVNIPKSLFVEGGLTPQALLDVNRSIVAIKGCGIFSSGEQGLAFSMSPLLQEAIRNSLSAKHQQEVLTKLSTIIEGEWKFSKTDPNTWPDARFYAPHVAAFCRFAEGKGFQSLVNRLKADLVFVATT